ncbi:MAG: hypothetical protein ACYDBX_00390 [Patescibacteria group bacterium]
MHFIKRHTVLPYKEKKLKTQILLLKIRIFFKHTFSYKQDLIDLIERTTNANLKQKSSINIKNVFALLLVFGVLSGGYVFAQSTTSSTSTLSQCAPYNGSGLSTWNSCGFTPSIFQSGAIEIMGNYTQYSNPASSAANFKYTGGYGALGTMTSLMGSMYTARPESGVGYFAYLGQKAGFINPTYAASASYSGGPIYGFSFLSPIEPLWGLTRNVAYFLLILIIIMTGIMIIIGGKIGGQIPITFMSALPNIVAAVILIEFSYALAGFMIDLMNILLSFVFFTFNYLGPNMGGNKFSSAFSSNMYIFNVFGTQQNKIYKALIAANPTITSLQNNAKHYNTGVFGGLLSMLGGLAKVGTSSTPISSIIAFIIAVILLFTAIKIFMKLLSSYIILVFLPVIAPFMFLFGAFPGQSKFYWRFFMGMFKALMAFVVVYLIFLVMFYLDYGNNGKPLAFGNGNSLPLLGFSSISSTATTSVITSFIAIGLFVLIPKLVSDVQNAISRDFGDYGTELKKNVSGPWASLRRGAKTVAGTMAK